MKLSDSNKSVWKLFLNVIFYCAISTKVGSYKSLIPPYVNVKTVLSRYYINEKSLSTLFEKSSD